MKDTPGKIIFVEGLPGTGKTSIAKWLHKENRYELFLEGNDIYPNTMYEIAGLHKNTFNELCADYPMLHGFEEVFEEYMFIDIGKIRDKHPQKTELISSLLEWDIGDEFNQNMDILFYISCSLIHFKRKFDRIKTSGNSMIMDSVWLQNPINELMFRNANVSQVIEYCISIVNMLSEYSSICIYLKRDKAVDSLNYAASIKGEQWQNGIISLITSAPYGRLNKLFGYSGVIKYFEKRAEIEELILSKKIIQSYEYIIEKNNWDDIKCQIKSDITRDFFE